MNILTNVQILFHHKFVFYSCYIFVCTGKAICLCLGPTGSGKTLFLKKLQNKHVDETSNTVPTVGTNLVTVTLANNKSIVIREIGGSMAPIWNNYYQSVNKLIFVVDASNLCQIASAGVLFYTLLTEPLLQHIKVSIIKHKFCKST